MLREAVRKIVMRLSLLFILAVVLTALFPSKAAAIPAWSRKYGVACATCHYPAPPRLNRYGHEFRRAQFRLPDEFNKEADWKSLGNYIAMRIRARYEYSSPEEGFPGGSTVKNSFKLNDATFFYAGPVAKNFSGFVELERPGDSAEIEAVVSIGGIRGKPDSFWTFRVGQFHTLARVGFGGLDRPTGISTPNALSRALVSGNGFKLNQDQVGVEATYVRKSQRLIGQILNGSDLTSGATTDQADENRAKDILLAYELMWGKVASGLTVFAYDGEQDDLTTAVAPDVVKIKRYGVTAAHVWKNGFEVQGGYVVGTDDYDVPVATVDSIDGSGYWVEVEKYFSKMKDLTIFGRYDNTDPNDDVDNDVRKQVTIGLTWPVADWHARWAIELRNVTQETAPPPVSDSFDDKQVVGELMLNF